MDYVLPTEERVVDGIFPPPEVPRCRKVIRVKQEAPNLSEQKVREPETDRLTASMLQRDTGLGVRRLEPRRNHRDGAKRYEWTVLL